MSEIFRCGDGAALTGYLYGEAAPNERRAVETHLRECMACAAELEGLASTREQLATWRPPAASLAFHVTRREADVTAPPVMPWWRQPMPGWMQAAAAVLVFGAGLSAGAGWNRASAPGAGQAPATSAQAVSPADLSSLEARLREEMNALRSTSSSAAPVVARASDDEALLRRVRTLIQESEERQQRALTLRSAELIRDNEIQRRLDMTNVQQSIGQMQGVTGAELREQRELWNALINRVGQAGAVR